MYHPARLLPQFFKTLALFAFPLVLVAPPMAAAAPEWKLENAAYDEAKPGSDGKPSMKIAPGGKASLHLSDSPTSGKVKMEIWDDGTAAIAEKGRGVGPRWGVAADATHVLVAGILYAPYLPPGGGYCTIDANPTDPAPWFNLKYLSPRKGRSGKWQTWVFDFNPDAGMTLSIDGKPVDNKRFNWNATRVEGLGGIVLYGDETGKPEAQTLWVGAVEYETGPAMNVKPTGPEPPKVVVPAEDPAPEGKVWQMKTEFQNTHPRLLLSKEELPKLREFYKSEAGRPWREGLEAYAAAGKPPTEPTFLKDATEGQRQGFWRMPTVALHYLLTDDEKSLANAKGFLEMLLALPNWETSKEKDSGMSAANIMVGAALTFDWCYDQLDPDFREKFRAKLLHHARAMYHGGHLKGNPGPYYWQNDPANNHRWHRNAGMTLSILAVYEGRPEEQWIMQKTLEDLEFVTKWLPHDGSCHEGPNYFTFGGNHLTVALDAADRTLGTEFLKHPYYKRMGDFRMHTLLPGMGGVFSFGDGGVGSLGTYNNFVFKGASVNRQSDIKDGLLKLQATSPKAFGFAWFSLLWDDPDLPRGKMENLPTKAIFEDVDFAVMRDSWAADAVAASFICGPFGGHDLLKFSDGGKNYINVAHDDPDALEFQITKGGNVMVRTDAYSKHKASQNHNTILINGMGQMTKGRAEGGVWSQPGGDMTKMAYVTGWKDAGKLVAIEGEASGSYLAYKSKKGGGTRPAMDRVRRTMLWMEGDYILILDDIRAPEEVDISWLVQSPKLTPADAGRFVLSSEADSLPMQIVADLPFEANIQDSPADHRGEPLGLRQLRATTKARALRFASIYDPWNRGELTVELKPTGPDAATVVVSGGNFADEWDWKSAADNQTVSSLSVKRTKGEGQGFPFEFDNTSNCIRWLQEQVAAK